MQPMFFKPAERSGQKLTGEAFQWGRTSAPVLKNTPAFVERRLVTTVEEGDHSIILGEFVDAGVNLKPEGRAYDATLLMKDLGDKTILI